MCPRQSFELADRLQYSTHLPALAEAILLTKGPVLEVGVGLASTPFLEHLCDYLPRDLFHAESNPEWAAFMKPRRGVTMLKHDTDFAALALAPRWGVVFLDQGPLGSERWPWAIEALPIADLVVIHDACRAHEGTFRLWEKAAPRAKFMRLYDRISPQTMILSNVMKP
jgi:hypothetical protein